MKNTAHISTLRLLHLMSPSLPTGGFCYSQGLETAVHTGWVNTADDMYNWLCMILHNGLATLDLPILQRCYQATECNNADDFHAWNRTLYIHRETAELRDEEVQRGRALWQVLQQYDLPTFNTFYPPSHSTQTAGIAYAGYHWGIDMQDLQAGFLYGWAENLVMASIKLIPLGQSAGQKILFDISEQIPKTIEKSYAITDTDIGTCTPIVHIASCLHETQPARMFRS